MSCSFSVIISTLRPRQNGRHFSADTFKCIFVNENVPISIKISLKYVPKSSANNMPALVQTMAWRLAGRKPLSEPMVVIPHSKVHGANMGPIRGRQDPGGLHVGPMNFAIWDITDTYMCHSTSDNWNFLWWIISTNIHHYTGEVRVAEIFPHGYQIPIFHGPF